MTTFEQWNDVSIYELSIGGIPVYIGSTINLKQRLSMHKIKHDACIVIDKCGDVERQDTEYMYIQLYKSWGFVLQNKMDSKYFGTNKQCPSPTKGGGFRR